MRTVDAEGSIDEVTQRLLDTLGRAEAWRPGTPNARSSGVADEGASPRAQGDTPRGAQGREEIRSQAPRRDRQAQGGAQAGAHTRKARARRESKR